MLRKRWVVGTATLAAMLISTHAAAHYLWLETNNGQTKLFFGEAEMLLKEKSPGRLDEFQAPNAFAKLKDGTSRPIALKRKENAILLSTEANDKGVYVFDESSPVKDLTQYGLGLAKSNYYAREGNTAPAGRDALTLDIRPEANNKFSVVYKGRPVKGAKVEVVAPNTWMQEHKTDEQGYVSINTPWKGQYVIHVLYIDKTPGSFDGKNYDSLRNHLTYTFKTTRGTEPGPAKAPTHAE